jgi:hypothetical protein
MLPFLKGALTGLGFGIVLYKVGATRYSRVMGMLTLRDTKIMKFAFTAIAIVSLGYGLAGALGVAEAWNLVPRTMSFLGAAHVLGGVMFGVAMGTSGLCPGTCAAKTGGQGGNKKFVGLASLLGLVLGVVVFANTKDVLLQTGILSGNQQPLTLHGMLGLPYAPVALALGAAILVVVLAVDRFTAEKTYAPAAEKKTLLDWVRGEWSYTAAGVVGGGLILLATVQGGYLGFSGALLAAVGGAAHVLGIPFSPVPTITDDILWRAALIVGVLPGGFVARLFSTPSQEAATHPVKKELDLPLLAKTTASITLMSAGALIGGGCTTGAFIAAWPTLSLGSFAMSLTFFATSMAVSQARSFLGSLDLPAAQALGDRVYD